MLVVDQNVRKLIQKLGHYIDQIFPVSEAKLIKDFSRHFYSNVAFEDLCDVELERLCEILVSVWSVMDQRKRGEINLSLYNPQIDKDDTGSSNTVIEVSCDDSPFLVDSMRLCVRRYGALVRQMIYTGGVPLVRDEEHRVIKILSGETRAKKYSVESPIYFELDRRLTQKEIAVLNKLLIRVLNNVKVVVQDWEVMREHMQRALASLDQHAPELDSDEIAESKEFIQWALDNKFIFFGSREWRIVKAKGERSLQSIPNSGCGVLRSKGKYKSMLRFSDLPIEARKLTLSSQILILAKTNKPAPVHREAYTDYIGIKQFDRFGKPIGEISFIGLYALDTYTSNPKRIPLLRHKINQVLKKSELNLNGYGGKSLKKILEDLPRDELFQASIEELLKLSIAILHLQERQRVRFFARKDSYGRFFSCFVFMPRDSFSVAFRNKVQGILLNALRGSSLVFSEKIIHSNLARIYFIIRLKKTESFSYDVKEIENRIREASRSFVDRLSDELVTLYGAKKGLLYFGRYRNIFPAGYQEEFSPYTAACDIKHLDYLNEGATLDLEFYHSSDSRRGGSFRFKLFRLHHAIPLSDVLPILENMGLRVLDESSHEIHLESGQSVWINDFDVTYLGQSRLNVDKAQSVFHEGFGAVWDGRSENDRFNLLILEAGLTWREVSVFRAYAKYLRQIKFDFSQSYIETALQKNVKITGYLIELFKIRFDPNTTKSKALDQSLILAMENKIDIALDEVSSLDEDRILRRYLQVILATVRTNYFQNDGEGNFKKYLSFKIDPSKISDIPLPHPMYEIFVYSPRFEGVHLRGAKVSRGGLRWSDRLEDYRTEILGLMKAQQVKNAVIVPLGAKGGFVCKKLSGKEARDEILAEGIKSYRGFIKGLLDVTDNLVEGKVLPPRGVLRYDEDDPYLVVAADKGTATFSDIANDIAKAYCFWLGDAFASGGSTGYDHKVMGITAKGAWESVTRHFIEMGVNISIRDFTVVGIGDMAGDVFGNGMLLSKHIKLVAAFNHMHIFIDPNPDSAVSYQERFRLFHLPRSSWSDYDAKKISDGGGVFSRFAKTIRLSSSMKALLKTDRDHLIPNELIRLFLKAEVDLLWNGGIGTFVKASLETHHDVGDRTNDGIRVNARELRCKVVGEGGNLGLTQLARVEFALNGGHLYTDFIDNSAGVDCSDREVNIKILLNRVVSDGGMTVSFRNKLLQRMAEEVIELVLKNNYRQTQAISLASIDALKNSDLYIRVIRELELYGKLDRELEYLPSDKQIRERKTKGLSLTKPEISILLSYTKIWLKREILSSSIPQDPYLSRVLLYEFPTRLRKKYYGYMQSHRLHKEIIATQVSNAVIDEMGVTFVNRLKEETGASVSEIVKAFAIARRIFSKSKLWKEIEGLDFKIDVSTQFFMMKQVMRVIRRFTRWFLRNHPGDLDIEAMIKRYKRPIGMYVKDLPDFFGEEERRVFKKGIDDLVSQGVPLDISEHVAKCSILLSVLDIVHAASVSKFSIHEVASAYFALGRGLNLSCFRSKIKEYSLSSYWDALARVAFHDDLDKQQCILSVAALRSSKRSKLSVQQRIEAWMEQNKHLFARWNLIIENIRTVNTIEPVMFSVGLRELLDLAQII